MKSTFWMTAQETEDELKSRQVVPPLKSDFEYSFHDGCYSVFPNSDAARETVNAMIREHGSNKLLRFEFEAFRLQARRAGYSVRKLKSVSVDEERLCAELTA